MNILQTPPCLKPLNTSILRPRYPEGGGGYPPKKANALPPITRTIYANPDTMTIKQEVQTIFTELGVPATAYTNGNLTVRTPITGEVVAQLPTINPEAANAAIAQAHAAYLEGRNVPAP